MERGPLIPDVAIHGTWVRSIPNDTFGRLCYKILNRHHQGSVEFLVVWEPNKELGTTKPFAGYADTEDLMVRPYKPRPWIDNPPQEVIYDANRLI